MDFDCVIDETETETVDWELGTASGRNFEVMDDHFEEGHVFADEALAADHDQGKGDRPSWHHVLGQRTVPEHVRKSHEHANYSLQQVEYPV